MSSASKDNFDPERPPPTPETPPPATEPTEPYSIFDSRQRALIVVIVSTAATCEYARVLDIDIAAISCY
jgi:hypothetical protein